MKHFKEVDSLFQKTKRYRLKNSEKKKSKERHHEL